MNYGDIHFKIVSKLKKIFTDQIDIIFMEKNLDGAREKPYFNVSGIAHYWVKNIIAPRLKSLLV